MRFEYDQSKSQKNKQKHGIKFAEAQELWRDVNFVKIPARMVGEPRFMIIGIIHGRHWSCIGTYRGDNIRIISVRRARKNEVELYEYR